MGQKPGEIEQPAMSQPGADEPARIRTQIERTRAEMSGTVDAIQEKLDPSVLKANAKEALRSATVGRAEEALSEAYGTAEEAIYSASESAREASDTMMNTMRRNPIPSLLAGVGLGWLYMNRTPKERANGRDFEAHRTSYGYDYSTPRSTYRGQESGGLSDVAEKVSETAGRAQRRAGEVASTATEAVRDTGSTVGDMVRENPIPAALVGLGLGWLMMNNGSSRGRGQYTNYHDAGYPDYEDHSSMAYGEQMRERAEGVRERAAELAGQAGDTASGIVEEAQETAGQVIGQAQATAEEVTSRVQDSVGQFSRQTQYRVRRVEDQFGDMVQTNPLALGVAALALGAVAGFVLPSTRREQELMGDASEHLVGQARSAAGEVMQKVQRVADEVQDTAQEQVRKEGLAQ